MTPRIVFLHIPKTAGQSVHALLVALFGPENISPARLNEHLVRMTVRELRRYRVTSGHLDWQALDCIPPPRFVFTVLREPLERIVSFYLFMRREAERLSGAQLALPQNRGKRAVLELPPDAYFTGGEPGLRTTLDDTYDNFYAHYFAGRRADARRRFIHHRRQQGGPGDDEILAMALDNLGTLDGVFTVAALAPLEARLNALAGRQEEPRRLPRINRGDTHGIADRLEMLRAAGATQKTFDRLQAMTRLDARIWQAVCADAIRRDETSG
jgi:hypothetical protein